MNGTETDYILLSAADIPPLWVERSEISAADNTRGARGRGKNGVTQPMSSVRWFTREYGIRHIEMPTASKRRWQAIQDAGGIRSASVQSDRR